MKRIGLLVAALAALSLIAGPALAQTDDLGPGTYAVMKTNVGTMVFTLFPDKAPKTVANFIGLAEGTKTWTDPATGEKVKKPLYDGVVFHRVIKSFMIQAGDPLGVGIGGPGYKFEDEFSPDLQFDEPFVLAMANSGPNTNGSQFFITERPTPHLNNRHTIFGKLVKGKEVMKKIASMPTKSGDLATDYPEVYAKAKKYEPRIPDRMPYRDRPATDVVIESITIKTVK